MTHSIQHEYGLAKEGEHKDPDTGLPVDLYHASGSMTAHNIALSVAVADSDTPTEIGSGFTSSLLHNVTFGGDHHLIPTLAGNYLILWSLSLDAGANDEIEAGFMVNGTAITKATAHAAPTAGKPHTLASMCIQKLDATDQVSLYVSNHTDSDAVTVEHGSLTIARLW